MPRWRHRQVRGRDHAPADASHRALDRDRAYRSHGERVHLHHRACPVRYLRGHPRPTVPEGRGPLMEKNIPQEIERFDISARVQHIIMFVTFLLLAFTGWGLKYAFAQPSSGWIKVWGGAKTAGIIHRVAGITMLLDFIYHQFYLLNLWRKKDLRLTIIPMPYDVVDLIHNFMYYLGLRKEKPYFKKFTYLQKFDYWAVYCGMFIMGTSGFF